MAGEGDDEAAIRSLIAEHFESMLWGEGAAPDWDRFRADFLPSALLIGAVRPVAPRSVEGFIERMETVARRNLQSFEEHTRGMKVLRFGNVAVVLAASELFEDRTGAGHDVSGYLLVKSEGRWSIAAQAWDGATADNPVPAEFQ